MTRKYNVKSRKELKTKLTVVFREKIQTLSTELQGILVDDLVTAFENRLDVLNRVQSTVQLQIVEGIECETI